MRSHMKPLKNPVQVADLQRSASLSRAPIDNLLCRVMRLLGPLLIPLLLHVLLCTLLRSLNLLV